MIPTNLNQFRMEDILLPDVRLETFIINLEDETTKKILDISNRQQEEVLKLKEVNEEQLRIVVKL